MRIIGVKQGGTMSEKGPRAGLLSIMLLFAISVSMIQGKKKKLSGPGADQTSLSVDGAINLINPLLVSKSFDAAAHALGQLDQATIMNVVQKLIADESYLDERDQGLLLLCLVAYLDSQSLHMQLYKQLQADYSNDPIYTYGLLENIAKGVERVHKLAQKQNSTVAKNWAQKSFSYAVEIDDPEVFGQLYSQGIRVSPEFASQLLSDVVNNQKSVAFVPFLVRTMQANPNYSSDGLKTLLIRAVELKNEPMVRALLEQGADPEKMLDEETGTASQIAYDKGYVVIEQLLKESRKK